MHLLHLLETNGNSRNADLAGNYDCLRALIKGKYTTGLLPKIVSLFISWWHMGNNELPTCCSKDIVHKPLPLFRPTDKEVCKSYELCLLLTWPIFKLLKHASSVIWLHNEYSFTTHDSERIFHPRSLYGLAGMMSHRLTNCADISTAACKC